jgi:hypothetical protein
MAERTMFQNINLELQGILAEKYSELVPTNKKMLCIKKSGYQSAGFINAGFDLEKGREQETDRHIFTVDFDDKSQLFVITGKIKSDNPYELAYLGVDLRGGKTMAYVFDGIGTITEFDLETGDTNTYDGKAGRPETLLHYMDRAVGRLIKTETFTEQSVQSAVE